MNNTEIINEYCDTRDLKPTTRNNLHTILNHYSKHQHKTLQELITEADQEEENKIRWKHRTLKKRLTGYINYCKNTMKINSVKTYLTVVKSFYYHHEIEVGKLPPINLKNAEINNPITYKDLPDKEVIRKACEISTPLFKALILFLSSSGMSKTDVLNLRIKNFILATKEYHNHDNIYEVVRELTETKMPIIPTWTNRRSKTNKYYITFNTPETTDEILNYLQVRMANETLTNESRLFKLHKNYYTLRFEKINTILGLGKVGNYNRFRGHMLRKFHASNLNRAGMDRYKINVLQGKSNNAVDDVYFFEDEETLKQEYIKAMTGLLIFTDAKVVTVDSPEVAEIKKQYEDLKVEVDKILDWFE